MTTALRHTTKSRPDEDTTLELGRLTVTLSGGTVRRLAWHGVELLRGVSYPIRDANWGTIPPDSADDDLIAGPDSAAYSRSFTAADGGFSGRFSLAADTAGSVSMDLSLTARRKQTVCRAGFTLLHPIVALAGHKLTIVHGDGSEKDTTFPEMISPSQPAFDIAGMRYEIHGCAIDIAMSGDIFEMEDQRNWSDASYKTYCRPLARPYPYDLEPGATIMQRIAVTMRGEPRSHRAANSSAHLHFPDFEMSETVPAVALAVEAGWQRRLDGMDGLRSVVRVDARADPQLPEIVAPFDLELITGDNVADALDQMRVLAARLAAKNLVPEHVIALPGAYLKSYQPDAQWPAGATPADITGVTRAVFANSRVGGGMLTNFTEFNRHRPKPMQVDYVSHGSSAIVHVADDWAIFQTIEALPQIFRSARAIAGTAPYRLGLVSIGMRTNPYGNSLADNVDGVPRTMTDDDPRARTRVGAAWCVAAMAATKGFGIEAITLGAPTGPFGIVDRETGRLRPSYHVIRGLHAMAGLPRIDGDAGNPDLHVVAVRAPEGIRLIIANGSPRGQRCRLPGQAQGVLLDPSCEMVAAAHPDWTETATTALGIDLDLSPYAVAFLTIPRGSESLS